MLKVTMIMVMLMVMIIMAVTVMVVMVMALERMTGVIMVIKMLVLMKMVIISLVLWLGAPGKPIATELLRRSPGILCSDAVTGGLESSLFCRPFKATGCETQDQPV